MSHRQRNSLTRISFAIPIHSIAARLAVAVMLTLIGALLAYAAVSQFIVSAITDERVTVDRATLATAVAIFPESARLQARLAASANAERDFTAAQMYAARALELSPRDYRLRLLMAAIKESLGDLSAAEAQLREALRLAPHKTEPHWQLANLLLRAGRLSAALAEFRATTTMNPRLLPVTLNIIWRATGQNLEAVDAIPAGDAKSRLALAAFLLKQSHVQEAARIFRNVDYSARRALAESRDFIGDLAKSDAALSRELWIDLVSGNSDERSLIWNGSFETEITKEFSQYDWLIDRSEYARIRVMPGVAHNGGRALRIDFLGRDTTRLTSEIRQYVVLRPGARYRLTAYAKAENLVTGEAPRIAVTTKAAPDWIAQSEPLVSSLTGWQPLAVEFTAPQLATGAQPAFEIAVRRKPKFSYDEPTSGTVWFDDFALVEVKP